MYKKFFSTILLVLILCGCNNFNYAVSVESNISDNAIEEQTQNNIDVLPENVKQERLDYANSVLTEVGLDSEKYEYILFGEGDIPFAILEFYFKECEHKYVPEIFVDNNKNEWIIVHKDDETKATVHIIKISPSGNNSSSIETIECIFD